jgi:hypothetical protein
MAHTENVMPYATPTGVWTGIPFQDNPKFCRGIPGKVFISSRDRETLRALAERVRALSTRSEEKTKRELWYAHNDLKTTRPLILSDPENGWNEIVTEETLRCEGGLARRWEVVLRKEIFWGERMRDDRPIEPRFYIGYTSTEGGWGIDVSWVGGKEGGSFKWVAPLKDISDVDRMRYPSLEIDYKTTLETLQLAADVFGGLLEVRLRDTWWWSFGFTIDLIKFVDLAQVMLDMYDKPELLHRVMGFLRDGFMDRLNFLEANRLLHLNNDDSYVGSGGIGYTRELPRGEIEEGRVRARDMWGFSESQETVGISPDMFEEFVYGYQAPVAERFGLNCYGCCEPLDKRWHVVKRIPNLRRVSVSAWADRKKMAEYLEDRYVYSWKPNPALLAVPRLHEEEARRLVRETLEITKGCVLEILMKDNHTVGRNPDNVTEWVRIVREEVDRFWK